MPILRSGTTPRSVKFMAAVVTNGWHQELRQCLIMLFVATAALLSCHYRARNLSARRCEWVASIAFCITLSLVIPARVRGLIHDYKNYPVCIESRTKSWRSGLSNGNTMIWWSPPRGLVADTFLFAPGVYNSESKAPGVADIMHFFIKTIWKYGRGQGASGLSLMNRQQRCGGSGSVATSSPALFVNLAVIWAKSNFPPRASRLRKLKHDS